MFETFHQSPHGDFKPTFYNPFEIKHRRRTTKAQFRVLENAFLENNKPNASSRRSLASKLGMTPRAVQVWFQNRRAKNKTGKCESSEFPSPTMSSSTMEDQSQKIRPQLGRNIVGLGRRHSMPDLQLSQGMLPFKELHEAIFGKNLSKMSFIVDQKQRKNSGCSANFLNSFLNLGLATEQYTGAPTTSQALYDPMISGDVNGRSTHTNTQDMTAPSISAPGSSPSLVSEDLYHLQSALRTGQPPNAAVVEAMAARLSSSLTPAELDMLIQNVSPKLDYYPTADLAALLFPGESVNPMELMGSQEFLFAQPFQDVGEQQF